LLRSWLDLTGHSWFLSVLQVIIISISPIAFLAWEWAYWREGAVSAAGDDVMLALAMDQIRTQAVSAVEVGTSVRVVTCSGSGSAVTVAIGNAARHTFPVFSLFFS